MTALSDVSTLDASILAPAEHVTAPAAAPARHALLDPGLDLTLRPMRYPEFYERYRDAIRNTWSVEEIDWSDDLVDLRQRLLPAERHLIRRLVAFFATGDSIVSNNLVLNLYKHLNSPEARLFLSRQLFEEAQHVQFYLTLLDTYVPDLDERAEAFAAIEHIASIRAKAEFCFKWMDGIGRLERLEIIEDRRTFLMNLICFAACIEGLFFFASFAYVYFLRSKGLLNGLAAGTNWVFRDESGHMDFAFSAVDVIRAEEPELFDAGFAERVTHMVEDAVEVEVAFAADVLAEGISGLSLSHVRQYLEYVADQRLLRLGISKRFGSKNPLDFMTLQDVAEHTNFFERTVSSYQVGVEGEVSFDEQF
jgi:ribonucleoside-diphosphate reductase beta chain